MDTELAARRWIDTWLRAWPEKDVDALAAVYGDDAPCDYWDQVEGRREPPPGWGR